MAEIVPTLDRHITWEVDAAGLTVTEGKRAQRVRWDEITRAALVAMAPPDVPAGMPLSIVPGMERLVGASQALSDRCMYLVLARGSAWNRALRVPLPRDDPESAALIETVWQHAGDRWLGEIPLGKQRELLGLRYPWWTAPFSILFVAALCPVVLLAMFAFESLTSLQFAEIPAVAWVALGVWLALVGVALWAARTRITVNRKGR